MKLSRKERVGIIALCSIIILLLSASAFMRHLFPPIVRLDEQQMQAHWQQMQAMENADNPIQEKEHSDISLFYFDPNTIDSSGLLQLGLKPYTAHALINWRNKGKRFYQAEEVQKLYSLSDKDYKRIAPYIRIKQDEFDNQAKERFKKQAPLPARINLNTIDSATLVRLDGIGSVLAHKIIFYRQQLGGFLQVQQLLEVYRFADSNMKAFNNQLFIIPNEVHKIKLNSVLESDLAQHPYIGAIMAKNIILLRKGLNKYENISQLRQVPLMNEEKYRKIAPYCTID